MKQTVFFTIGNIGNIHATRVTDEKTSQERPPRLKTHESSWGNPLKELGHPLKEEFMFEE